MVTQLANQVDPEDAEEGEGKKTDDRGRRTEGRRRKTDDRGRRTEDRRRRVAGPRGAEGGALVDRVSMGKGR